MQEDEPAGPHATLCASLEIMGNRWPHLALSCNRSASHQRTVEICHQGSRKIVTPRNFALSFRVMCCSAHHSNELLQMRVWIEFEVGRVYANRSTRREFKACNPTPACVFPDALSLRPYTELFDDFLKEFLEPSSPLTTDVTDHHLLPHNPVCQQAESSDGPSDATSDGNDSMTPVATPFPMELDSYCYGLFTQDWLSILNENYPCVMT